MALPNGRERPGIVARTDLRSTMMVAWISRQWPARIMHRSAWSGVAGGAYAIDFVDNHCRGSWTHTNPGKGRSCPERGHVGDRTVTASIWPMPLFGRDRKS